MDFFAQLKRLVAPATDATSLSDERVNQVNAQLNKAAADTLAAANDIVDLLSAVNDEARLRALYSTGMLDANPEEMFDSINALMCKSIKAPTGLIDLIDTNRMYVVSQYGIGPDAPEYTRTQSWPLEASFCKHVVQHRTTLIIPNACENDTVRDNLATLNGSAVAYMGAPICVNNTHIVGVMCAFDNTPREWTTSEREILEGFTNLVTRFIELKILMNTSLV